MARASKKTPPADAAPSAPDVSPGAPLFSPSSAAALVALGLLSALWALALWSELAMARVGATPFCSIDAQLDCLRVWDSPFASAVHRITRVPVAGWGLAWSVVAAAFPLVVLLRRAEGRVPPPVLLTATRLHAAAGLVAVFVLAGVSLSAGALCLGCLGTYVLVGAYGFLGLFGWSRVGLFEAPRAALLTAGAMFAAFLLVLYPGMRTPRNLEEAGREALRTEGASAARTSPEEPTPPALLPSSGPGITEPAAAPSPGPSALALGPAGTGDPKRDARLQEFIHTQPDDVQQVISNSLAMYREGMILPTRTPRAVQGPANAPVRITEFTDVLCPHCATLHDTMIGLREQLPPGSFSVDSRQYPLDMRCNAHMQQAAPGDPVRCVAAFARVCMEKTRGAEAFATAIFKNQRELSLDRIYALGEPYMARAALEACVLSEETHKKVADDVAFATTHHPEGTPLVLVNGRKASAFGPFLFSIILSGGRDRHPAFDALPKPEAFAHVH